MAHLTCQGHTRAEIAEILADYRAAGIENILALGGDPPADAGRRRGRATTPSPPISSPTWRPPAAFSVGVAAHPEVHPRSPDRAADRRLLAAKLARGRLRHHPVLLRGRALPPPGRRAGRARAAPSRSSPASCRSPTPARSPAWPSSSGAAFPAWLAERLDARPTTPTTCAASAWRRPPSCAPSCSTAGAPGLHFYTLNRSTATREIYANLGLPV